MRILSVLCLMILLVTTAPGYAQDAPLVVFIEEPRTLTMSSVTDTGPDGISRLAEMFRSLGAQTSWVRLSEPVPDEARVIVLVRPRGALTPAFLARLYQHVGTGSSLMIALDPPGYLSTRTEMAGGGLDKLLTNDDGISLYNGILVYPWFNNQSFRDLFSTFSLGYPDPVPNPINAPALQYDLPIGLWGARPLRVEPFGADSRAWSLADAAPVYSETATNIFPTRTSDGSPLFEINLDKDRQGILTVAAYGENTKVGARVAVLGDGEFVQNGYGLKLNSGSGMPAFPANYIMTQRLAAWLLHLPEDQYPPLPAGLTWIALDGSVQDWTQNAPVTHDDPADASILSLNIQQVQAFYNDSYLYMAVETVSQANHDSQIDLELDTTGNGQADTIVSMQPGYVIARSGDQPVEVIPDADMAIGDGIELRLPLRLTGQPPRVLSLCISSGRELAFSQSPDCMESPVQIGRVNQPDPAPLRYTDAPVLVVRGDGSRANVRRAPNTTANILVSVPYGTVFAAIGRTEDGAWVQVMNGAYEGWVSRQVLFAEESNLDSLPITG